uniref:Uncharacterized protein n=1 Tax=Anguilla anguilla TaxID=7936 RepID=A0A0E9QB63_ANGAN
MKGKRIITLKIGFKSPFTLHFSVCCGFVSVVQSSKEHGHF